MQVGLEQYFKVVTVKYINIYSIAFGLQMLLDNEVCFKKVFITFFTVPDVCGDVWNYVVVDGNGSLSTSMGRPAQKPETKKNSVFQFLSEVTRDLINL